MKIYVKYKAEIFDTNTIKAGKILSRILFKINFREEGGRYNSKNTFHETLPIFSFEASVQMLKDDNAMNEAIKQWVETYIKALYESNKEESARKELKKILSKRRKEIEITLE